MCSEIYKQVFLSSQSHHFMWLLIITNQSCAWYKFWTKQSEIYIACHQRTFASRKINTSGNKAKDTRASGNQGRFYSVGRALQYIPCNISERPILCWVKLCLFLWHAFNKGFTAVIKIDQTFWEKNHYQVGYSVIFTRQYSTAQN